MIQDELARRVGDLIAHRVPFAQATVVRAQRPTSVRAGDGAIVLADGSIEGFVGGTCAEGTVRLHGLRALATGEPLLLRILPEPDLPRPEEPAGQPAAAVRAAAGEGAVTVRNPCLSGGALEIFLEPHVPPARVLVVGSTPTARALADLGTRLGYHVEASADGDILPGAGDAAVVVASHGRDEERALTRALRAGVPYVGLVASRRRGAEVAAALDLPAPDRARVRTPAGLDIGARTAAEIALSILAEVTSLRPRQATWPARTWEAPAPDQEAPSPDREEPAPDRLGEGAARDGAAEEGTGAAAIGGGIGTEAATGAGIGAEAPAAAGKGIAEAPATATDPVCGMAVTAAEPTRFLDTGERRVWFCGDGCLLAYQADPAAYA